MEIIPTLLKYTFVVAVVVEAVLIGRAIFNLAREKARAATSPATEE
ncbi:hypothetical protein [Chloroflexus sp.]|nr:hypothetical protein [uncultured Chloroflexus sp.]